ncbi:MAG: BMP family ABC transporter substrate-binding protein, partial [Bacillota bacterium]
MKRIGLLMSLALVVVLFMALCAGPGQTADRIRIALVLPSTMDDMAWSQSMYEGLKAVQKEMGEGRLDLAVSERLANPVDAGAAIRQYADQRYDIVIAHGAQYQSVLMEIA